MSDLIAHAKAIADDATGMDVGDRECVAQLIDRIAELEAENERLRAVLYEIQGYDGNGPHPITVATKALAAVEGSDDDT